MEDMNCIHGGPRLHGQEGKPGWAPTMHSSRERDISSPQSAVRWTNVYPKLGNHAFKLPQDVRGNNKRHITFLHNDRWAWSRYCTLEEKVKVAMSEKTKHSNQHETLTTHIKACWTHSRTSFHTDLSKMPCATYVWATRKHLHAFQSKLSTKRLGATEASFFRLSGQNSKEAIS